MTRRVGSITHLAGADVGLHVLTGSHGGAFVGDYALKLGVASLVCHDAGIGLERAGIAALAILERHAVPAAAVDYRTARIGDADDMHRRGKISCVNAAARALGVEVGATCADAALGLSVAEAPARRLALASGPDERPHRHTLDHACTRILPRSVEIVCLDSASDIGPDDCGKVVLTGSHGGLPGGDAANAIKAAVGLAAFNDAGIGIDDAGVARLAPLDAEGVPAFTVAAASARIGDGCSTYRTGIVSRANTLAHALGIDAGMTVASLLAPVSTSDRAADAVPRQIGDRQTCSKAHRPGT